MAACSSSMPASIPRSRSSCSVMRSGGVAATCWRSRHLLPAFAASCAASTGSMLGCAKAATRSRWMRDAALAAASLPLVLRRTAPCSTRSRPERGAATIARPAPFLSREHAMAYIDNPATQRANLGFIKASMRTPLLTRDRELTLARRWRDADDTEALHELVRAYTRLAVSLAARFRSYGLPMG